MSLKKIWRLRWLSFKCSLNASTDFALDPKIREGVNPNVCGALEGTGNKASKVSGEEFIAAVIL